MGVYMVHDFSVSVYRVHVLSVGVYMVHDFIVSVYRVHGFSVGVYMVHDSSVFIGSMASVWVFIWSMTSV